MTDAERFLLALAGGQMQDDERIILCSFHGDPNTAGKHAWRPRPYKPGNEIVINERHNGYATIACFTKADDDTFRRRNECFRAGLALMIDDVGTKVSKNESWPPPSAIVETSPGNEQWWYFLDKPERDGSKFNAIIKSFIDQALLGNDPGMGGVTRVGRLPGFINGKEKYKDANGKPFVTRLVKLNERVRYSVDALAFAFGLRLRIVNTNVGVHYPPSREELSHRINAFINVRKFLRSHGMIRKYDSFDKSGWMEIHCPWTDEHTGGADNGAAIREPADENGWYGAFRCHHGHCADRRWFDFTEWVNDEVERELFESAHRDIPFSVIEASETLNDNRK